MRYMVNMQGDFESRFGGKVAYIYELAASVGQRSAIGKRRKREYLTTRQDL